jgi:flagellar hook assembly protein FlgD
VSLKVYDVSGRLVRVLVDGNREAREYEAEWDGTNGRGERAASGVYFYHLTTAEARHIRKAVLLR